MKLVKRGQKLEKVFSATCNNCGDEYEASQAELRVEYGDQRDPGAFAHHECPNCKNDIVFYPKR